MSRQAGAQLSAQHQGHALRRFCVPRGKLRQGPVHVRLVDGIPMEEPRLHSVSGPSFESQLFKVHVVNPCKLSSWRLALCGNNSHRVCRADGHQGNLCFRWVCAVVEGACFRGPETNLEPLFLLAQAPRPRIHNCGSNAVQVDQLKGQVSPPTPYVQDPTPSSQCLSAKRVDQKPACCSSYCSMLCTSLIAARDACMSWLWNPHEPLSGLQESARRRLRQSHRVMAKKGNEIMRTF